MASGELGREGDAILSEVSAGRRAEEGGEEEVDEREAEEIEARVARVTARFGGHPVDVGERVVHGEGEGEGSEGVGEGDAGGLGGSERREGSLAVLVIGMAGSGKTTLVQRLLLELYKRRERYYSVNLDPAVRALPYTPNLDIRDAVKYKEVQEKYGLGPNGAILTSLNLFVTRADEVVSILERRHTEGELGTALVDTPGQIEVFTWSASGAILTESVASTVPTVVLFVVDALRCSSPATFMSSMLYACSVLYRTRLPLVVALNKADVADVAKLQTWMRDMDAFLDALDTADEKVGFMGTLLRSMALALDEFYNALSAVPVSAATGEGSSALLHALDAAAEEYRTDYLPAVQRAKERREARREAASKEELRRLEEDDPEPHLRAAAAGEHAPPSSIDLHTLPATRTEGEGGEEGEGAGGDGEGGGDGDGEDEEQELTEEDKAAVEELKRLQSQLGTA